MKLLHFHLGSQITNIRIVKGALNEAARVYTELAKLGAGLQYIDVGGGLGVDYDGSQTNFESSMNYTLEEYANDVVYHIQSVCDEAGIPHPTIISESGRAVVAYHSVLVFNVLGVSGFRDGAVPMLAIASPVLPPPEPKKLFELTVPESAPFQFIRNAVMPAIDVLNSLRCSVSIICAVTRGERVTGLVTQTPKWICFVDAATSASSGYGSGRARCMS